MANVLRQDPDPSHWRLLNATSPPLQVLKISDIIPEWKEARAIIYETVRAQRNVFMIPWHGEQTQLIFQYPSVDNHRSFHDVAYLSLHPTEPNCWPTSKLPLLINSGELSAHIQYDLNDITDADIFTAIKLVVSVERISASNFDYVLKVSFHHSEHKPWFRFANSHINPIDEFCPA